MLNRFGPVGQIQLFAKCFNRIDVENMETFPPEVYFALIVSLHTKRKKFCYSVLSSILFLDPSQRLVCNTTFHLQ